jgi:hypothetical protein
MILATFAPSALEEVHAASTVLIIRSAEIDGQLDGFWTAYEL